MNVFNVEPSTCPPLTQEMVSAAEKTLGYKLPESYLSVLREHNGGELAKTAFPLQDPDSGKADFVQVAHLFGILGSPGSPDSGAIDAIKGGSQHLIKEWGYPDTGIIISCDGEVGVMLDYSECGPQGEPRVVYLNVEDENETFVQTLAPNFAAFISGLIEQTDDM